LRRILVIATTLGVLVAASAAYAAINSYSASLTFTSKQAGTKKKPVPIGYTQVIEANGTGGNRTAVLLDIKTKVYGLTADGKDFPTCSFNKIATAQTDAVCPKGAEVATGSITSVVGSSQHFNVAGTACDPLLDVWNSGQGKLTYFFVDTPTHQCLGGALVTGQVGPYAATYKQVGKYLVTDVPVPGYVSFPLGAAGGVAGSLETEHLKWLKVSKKVHGKTVSAIASVGCLGHKRPYSMTFTATIPSAGPAKEVDTVSHSAPC
jgi:hypothetical protein